MNSLDLSKYVGHTPGPWTDLGKSTGDIYQEGVDYPLASPIIECDGGSYGPYGPDRALIIDAPMLLKELIFWKALAVEAGENLELAVNTINVLHGGSDPEYIPFRPIILTRIQEAQNER